MKFVSANKNSPLKMHSRAVKNSPDVKHTNYAIFVSKMDRINYFVDFIRTYSQYLFKYTYYFLQKTIIDVCFNVYI